MIRDELYINGDKVDVGDTDISLNYKSNLLTDISKIVSNNSYTIKLPKTAKNLALIECSHLPSSTTKFPYLKHVGNVLRNGIIIVKDANVVLLSVSEYIETALSWGNVTNFAEIVSSDKKLTDLEYGTEEGTDWVVWNNKGSNSAQFPLINYGFNSGDSNVWYHPAITVKWILEKIQEESGVTFNFPSDKKTFIDKMIVPLLTRNDSQKINDAFPSFLKMVGYVIVESTFSYLKLNYIGDSTQQYASVGGPYGDRLYTKYPITLKVKGTIEMLVKYNSGMDVNNQYLNLRVSQSDSSGNISSVSTIERKNYAAYIEAPNVRLLFNFDDLVSIGSDEFMHFTIEAIATGASSSVLSLTVYDRNEISFGEKFPLVPNLPDIKQIDFIKAVASMVGLFALPDGENGIKFIPFDNLSANKSKAVDWTNRVIMAYNSVTPRNLQYTLDNIAQNNWFRYKEDDNVMGNYDGNIQVDDATIEYERDAISLPFSACSTKGGVAYIPLYSYNDNGELQYNKVNPRILLLDGTKGIFKGLEWTTLIANNYQTYKGLINNAKVVTEYIRLNSIELRDLEMDIPVYLAQYGCYLAIIEIKTKENDICECKLLKL
ncbi:hypothetical protein [Bacteroides xylanisolvens]|uniref:hypothetical protein n=1 Tax=Bacteroides xylanisolvens TaxID=371601 RepID=UPI001C37A6F9|nr:hypothetical protein [Bacteroides xylanisolvens]MBV3838432.1 hypothetical protein [Bacteroides xylanisolvens]